MTKTNGKKPPRAHAANSDASAAISTESTESESTESIESQGVSLLSSASGNVDEARTYQERAASILEAKRLDRLARRRQGGLVMVYTGEGKGKTSAALGLITRALGHRQKVAVVQFVKGRWQPGETIFWKRYAQANPDEIYWHAMGEGFSWTTQDRARDQQAAHQAWQQSCVWLQDATVGLVVLDELNIVVHQGLLSPEDVVKRLEQRPAQQNVVLTGRYVHPVVAQFADMVSEVLANKHHRDLGYAAQKGVEF